jgi:sodium pump decarboxylase gamma subunit
MENLGLALQISGIGIVALFFVLVVLAGIISLMTKYLVDKPEKQEEEAESEAQIEKIEEVAPESNQDLKLAAAIALAIYRSQVEMSAVSPVETGVEVNSWRQIKLINRLNQSSNIRRGK